MPVDGACVAVASLEDYYCLFTIFVCFLQTNSAYMLFYERVKPERAVEEVQEVKELRKYNVELTLELNEWIWKDNMQFLQDQNIFEHTYFG